ncbi:MAG: non-heme iron oxygenase ferredoxin subunit [Burkholderiales bacterium]|jgi:3-phenylpropionate/trans-cinnamate dioxygenase ferredoxin subunit
MVRAAAVSAFVEAAKVDELAPGRMKRIDIGGRRILLANVQGRFYAADDTCTHEEASLSKGFLKGELVKCPLHGSRFNVRTGEALEEPAEENLKTYPVRLQGERILIDLSEAGTP